MGTLKTFLDDKSITAKQIAITSKRIEQFDSEGRGLMMKRVEKRRVKETADKKYAELNLAKPKQMGRGVSELQVVAALSDKPVARKVRAKIFRAVNTLLTKKGQGAAEFKALFEGSKAKVGKKAKEATAAKS